MLNLNATPRPGLWRNHDFLRLWSGETVAQIGAQVTQLALPLLVLGVPGAGAGEVGLVAGVQLLPALCVTPLAGLLIDLWDRRRILLGANLGRALALTLVPVLYLTDTLSIAALCAVAFVVGACTAVFEVAYIAYLPVVVEQDDLVEANSKLQASYSVSQIGGPGLGGLLTKALGAWFAILANVASYLAAFVLLWSIRHREPAAGGTGADRPRLRDMFTSFALLWRHRVLRVLTFQAGWFNFCEQAILTLFLVYAVKELGMDAGGVGVVLALGALGSLLGATAAKRLGEHLGFGPTLVAAMGVASCAPLLLALTDGPGRPAHVLAVLAFGLYGFGLTIYNVHVVAFRQAVIPLAVIGRATAAYRMLTYGPFPLGAFVGGFLGERIGLGNSVLVTAVLSVVGWLLFALVGSRHIRAAQPAGTPATHGTGETPETPETPQVSETSQTSQTSQTPETPEICEISEISRTGKTSETGTTRETHAV
ncbi:MFS transporter [Streptomyces sp. WAC06614]|uniref:MFS transporter n=1 Tax=Streptomyces sp. WAC06614 TaxID=2487416 RepID=UPI000F78380C|nr:MFS transporter [Streptomyces sp. WAC06614]RSS78583.1 MFS transporter [Streptomyces sp. WAC06614]